MASRWCVFVAALWLAVVSPSLARNGARLFFRGRMYGGNLGLPPTTEERDDVVSVDWFDQQLDHFTPSSEATWKQQYFVNAAYYTKGGPAFLQIGGEGPASQTWMTQGEWIATAKEVHAICFQLEHRFYGKSQPFSNLSVESLKYLNSEQALADLAFFIQAMNKQYKLPENTKWVAFGGSYPGSLAAWLRVQYPHLVHAAMSASGPLIAKVDFDQYFVVVRDAIRETSESCLTAITTGTKQIGQLLATTNGQQRINKIFKLCQPIDTSKKLDVANFYEGLADNFAGIVQYNKDNRISNSTLSRVTINDLCDIMNNPAIGEPVDRLAKVNSFILKGSNSTCLDYTYDNLIKELANTSLSAATAEGGRQWTWQTCVEFGFFQTSTKVPELFGDNFPVDFFLQQCIDIFSPELNRTFVEKAIQRTNTIYGALHLHATQVVYVHGSIDPWHALGMTKTLNKEAPAIYILGTAHCANMYPKSPKDPEQLIKARQLVRQYLKKWLGNDFQNTNTSLVLGS